MRSGIIRSLVLALIISAALLFVSAQPAEARGALLAERKIAHWGGLESRTRCTSKWSMHVPACKWFKCKRKKISGCKEWTTDFKQRRVYARIYGPNAISNPDSQLKKIARACLASGLVLAGAPALVASVVDLDLEVLRLGVEACLATQNVLSQIVAPGFKVTIDKEKSWD